MFELEAVHAGKGDALIVRWGSDERRALLVDGGQEGPYREHLQKRLQQLADGGILALPLVVVSHVDADHIEGILRLFGDLDTAHAQGVDPPYEIGELWHNGFHDLELVDRLPKDLRAAVREAATPAALDTVARKEGSRATVESYRQGRTLIQRAVAHDVPRNAAFTDGFVQESGTLRLDGLEIEVICPDGGLLDALAAAWAKDLAKLLKERPGVEAASVRATALGGAFDDASVPNQSSIVLLVSHEGRTMLLTGDARGDHLLAALRRRGHTEAEPIEVDVFKVGHHASVHSNKPEVFDLIKARHYVVSGNGHHGNPHPVIIRLIVAECLARDAELHLTNVADPAQVPDADVQDAKDVRRLLDAAVKKGLRLSVRGTGQPGVTVSL